NRVVDKLLHAPSVRVKQLAGEPGGETYAEALRELFGLTVAGGPTGRDEVGDIRELMGALGDLGTLGNLVDNLDHIDHLAVAVTAPPTTSASTPDRDERADGPGGERG